MERLMLSGRLHMPSYLVELLPNGLPQMCFVNGISVSTVISLPPFSDQKPRAGRAAGAACCILAHAAGITPQLHS
jgi:hypothetical protein